MKVEYIARSCNLTVILYSTVRQPGVHSECYLHCRKNRKNRREVTYFYVLQLIQVLFLLIKKSLVFIWHFGGGGALVHPVSYTLF